MPRQTTDQAITTRAARERLAARPEPYWRAIDAGIALGYRKARNGGTWIGRVLIEGRYREGAIGRADHAINHNGVTFLDYRQAEAKLREWATAQHHKAAGLDDGRAQYSVADALRDYLVDYNRRGSKGLAQTAHAVDAHIIPALGTVRLDRLTRQRIRSWRDELVDAAPRLRTAKTATAQQFREIDPSDPDVLRRRRATANRVLSILKAALNHAHHLGRIPRSDAWATVKSFKGADAPKVAFLTDAAISRLVDACRPDLRRIVIVALLTGMRYGEIARFRVADFNPNAGTATVATSKGGRARHVFLTDEGRAFFAQAATGKAPGELMFTRGQGEAWGKSHQFRPLRDACAIAGEIPAIGFHVLRHTYASRLAERGASMSVIAAQLGHEGTRITERHYAHLTPSYVRETVRSLFGTTGLVPPSTIAASDIGGTA